MGRTTVNFNKEGIDKKLSTHDLDIKITASEDGTDEAPQTMTAWLTVYSPVYDAKEATTWQFKYGDHVIDVDISDTDIVKSTEYDTYRVKLEIMQYINITAGRLQNTSYRIKDGLDAHSEQLTIYWWKRTGKTGKQDVMASELYDQVTDQLLEIAKTGFRLSAITDRLYCLTPEL